MPPTIYHWSMLVMAVRQTIVEVTWGEAVLLGMYSVPVIGVPVQVLGMKNFRLPDESNVADNS